MLSVFMVLHSASPSEVLLLWLTIIVCVFAQCLSPLKTVCPTRTGALCLWFTAVSPVPSIVLDTQEVLRGFYYAKPSFPRRYKDLPPKTPLPGYQPPRDLVRIGRTCKHGPTLGPTVPLCSSSPNPSFSYKQVVRRPKGRSLIQRKAPL